MLKLKRQTQKHCWSNGRISPCQGGGPGPIPGQCNFFFFKYKPISNE